MFLYKLLLPASGRANSCKVALAKMHHLFELKVVLISVAAVQQALFFRNSEWCQILPIAAVKMFCRSIIYEMY